MQKLSTHRALLFLAVSLLIASLIFSSCEEVIDVDLNSAHPVLVAEGYMERDSLAWVQLNYTADYFKAGDTPPEEEALVTLTTPGGESELLLHEGNGMYRGQNIRGAAEGAYSLAVEVDGEVHQGISRLTPVPELLSVELEDFFFTDPNHPEDFPKTMILNFSRPVEDANYLMLKLKLNGEVLDEPFALATDEYYTGIDTMRYTTFVFPPPLEGDTLELQFFSIDEDAFRYYYQISEAISGMAMSTAPYNPASNLDGEILGYFMARTPKDTTIYF